jgi:hypothetical protein
MIQENETIVEHLQNLRNVERLQTGGADAVRRYAEIHSYRFNRTAHFCRTLVSDSRARILDIGVSQLTVLLKQYYTRVTTLGWNIADDDGGQRTADVLIGEQGGDGAGQQLAVAVLVLEPFAVQGGASGSGAQ